MPSWYNLVSMFGAAQLTDQIVRDAVAGSRDALGRILDQIGPQVRLMVAARLSPRLSQIQDAEDLVQESLGALTRSICKLEAASVDGLRSYLSGIVAHQVAAYLRRRDSGGAAGRVQQSLDSAVSALSEVGPLWQFLSYSGTSPLSAADRADQARRLFVELGKLKAVYREVIALAFFDQLEPREIGARLGLSRRAASMLLLRAVRVLREAISPTPRPSLDAAQTRL